MKSDGPMKKPDGESKFSFNLGALFLRLHHDDFYYSYCYYYDDDDNRFC